MIKKITYILIPTCMTLSVAIAEPVASNPILLTAGQMDQVTAGLGALVNVGAIAESQIFSLTRTNAAAITAVTNNDNPAFGGYIEIAGGGAVATAAGDGSSTDTAATSLTSTQGWAGSYTNQAGGHFKGSLIEVRAHITYTSGSVYVSPL
ncbi:MAG: hypothetical protein GQ583_11805 [Methyloprofundus sp.]|nr:hypothetical protein [Methyloprofundus sp.]